MDTGQDAPPTDTDARRIAQDLLGQVHRLERFETGASHYVYDVWAQRRAVLRLALPSRVISAQGAVLWSNRLRPMGVPLPEILYADLTMTRYPWPILLLQRFPGRDLGDELAAMTLAAQASVATQLMAAQDKVATLPHAGGYGFLAEPDKPGLPSWGHVLTREMDRARSWLREGPLHHLDLADQLEDRISAIKTYADDVAATPFLHDITTKNVIVHEGQLSGIIDVDDLCFGDPLFLVALIRMAVLAHDLPRSYADLWQDQATTPAQRRAVDTYTAIFALLFLGETYQRFNRDAPQGSDQANRAKLIDIFQQHLGRL